ncbi:MAG: SusC/RagA family protein [Cytophagaceae bacterium]|nr:SusC/RagA family protein [Cytophagaceae bacterium]
MKNYTGRVSIRILVCSIFITSLYTVHSSTTAPFTPNPFANLGIVPAATSMQQQVGGTVRDADGMPLPGVTVRLKDNSRGTTTTLDGTYLLPASPTDTLVFSYVGFTTQEIAVNDRTTINIILEEDITSLDAVTINAGYYNTTERERTGNISRVDAEEIERQPVTHPLAVLQGRMPGVYITQNTGVPGGEFEIQVRGTNSIGAGNAPLYIVDGVPFSSSSLGYNVNSYVLSGNISPLNSINPADIANIEVLKDADATAIYGSRGANGVVLITTRQGKVGKAQLALEVNTGIAEVGNFVSLMGTTEYLEMRREGYANDGVVDYPSSAYDVNGTWDPDRYNDWQEILIGGVARQQQANLRLGGGSERTRYLLGGTFRRETTVFPGDNAYTKGGFLANMNHGGVDDPLHVSLSMNYVIDHNDLPGEDLTNLTRTLAPNAPNLYNDDGSLNWADNTWANPIASRTYERFDAKSRTLILNGRVDYRFFKHWVVKANLGLTTMNLQDKKVTPSTKFNPDLNLDSSRSLVSSSTGERSSWISEPQLEYENTWGKIQLTGLVGMTFQEENSSILSLRGRDFPSNELLGDLSAASILEVRQNVSSSYRYQAVFGRVNLNWDGKYILNITSRRDGSSRFGTDRRYANFGAVGAAWLFSRESLFTGLDFLSFGKLRGSYGITGNDQIGDYEYLDTYSLTGRSYGGLSGLAPTQLFNPTFGWETNRKLELGLALGFVDDHIRTEVSFFLNRSGDQLVGIPQPGTTGFTMLRSNLDAIVENRGWEVVFNSVNIDTDNFSWSSGFNITIPKNELVSYPGLEGSTYANQLVVGKSLNIQKLYVLDGVDTDSGVYTFRDFNGDGELSSLDDRGYIASLDPRFYGGLNNDLRYGNWHLNFLFQFVSRDNRGYLSGIPGGMVNQPLVVTDRWEEAGDEARFQQYSSGRNRDVSNAYLRFRDSDGNWEDASYIRLKNISLEYTLSKKILKQLAATLYLRGQNLLTITGYEGLDPESPLPNILPPLRQYNMGVKLTF